jgi:hypothetical protein
MKVSKVEINNQYLRYPQYSLNDIVKAEKAAPPRGALSKVPLQGGPLPLLDLAT